MILVVKKTAVIVAIILVAVFIVGAVVTTQSVKAANTAAAKKLLPIYGGSTDTNKVAISFDAAWGSDKTEAILDILDKYGVKATFFLVGFWVDKNPDLVKEIASRGHLIGNHSTNHPHFNKLSLDEMRLETETTAEKITALTGEEVKFFRAPFGEYNVTLLTYLNESGVKCIQWTVDTLDWKGISGKEIADRVLNQAKSGSIILCHNNSDHILDALPVILLGLQNKGLDFVRMDELVINDDYYLDNNGIQHPAV